MKNTAPQFTLAEMRDGHWYIRRSNPSGTFTLLARLDAIPDGAQPGDWAEMVAALNERADNPTLRAALESIARAPAFDSNTQALVDLARNTLARTKEAAL